MLKLNRIGETVEKYIKEIISRYENISVDRYVIIPNHMHMILIITEIKDMSVTITTIIPHGIDYLRDERCNRYGTGNPSPTITTIIPHDIDYLRNERCNRYGTGNPSPTMK